MLSHLESAYVHAMSNMISRGPVQETVIIDLSRTPSDVLPDRLFSALQAMPAEVPVQIRGDQPAVGVYRLMSEVEPSAVDWYVDESSEHQWTLHIRKLAPKGGCCGCCGG